MRLHGDLLKFPAPQMFVLRKKKNVLVTTPTIIIIINKSLLFLGFRRDPDCSHIFQNPKVRSQKSEILIPSQTLIIIFLQNQFVL